MGMAREFISVASSSADVRRAVESAAEKLQLSLQEHSADASVSQILYQSRICVVDVSHLATAQLTPLLDALTPDSRDDDVLVIHLGADRARLQLLRYSQEQLVGGTLTLLAGLVGTPQAEDPTQRLLGRSNALELVRDQTRSVARFVDVSVLILGASGTGKELVARAIHELSFGMDAPFVAINCSAISPSLFESELFGHEAGSFTGARSAKTGLFEAAAEGTLFLDEIGEMPEQMQAKLLRTLELREFRRVGGTKTHQLSARVISATHRGVGGKVGTLRLDLYFRLAGFTIMLPPLIERGEDIVLLARHYVALFCRRHQLAPVTLSPEAEARLAGHAWPGNVRELRAIVENAVIASREPVLSEKQINLALLRPSPFRRSSPPEQAPTVTRSGTFRALDTGQSSTLRDFERDMISSAFNEASGNLSQAARILGIPRSTLRDKLRRYGLI